MNQLLYYSTCRNDEPVLHKISECLRLHSSENKAAFSIIALYEATRPQEILVNHSFDKELIELLMQLSFQGKMAVSRAISEEINVCYLWNASCNISKLL